MILRYLTENYITLMILMAMVVIMLINRKDDQIPGTRHFSLAVAMLLALTITDFVESFTMNPSVRMFCAALSYILRPLIILIEVLIISPKKKYRPLIIIPGIINGIIFSTAFFGSHLAFYIDKGNSWHGGPLSYSIYFTQMFYVFLLALFSIIYLKRYNDVKRSAIVFLIVVQAIISAVFENSNLLVGTANPITALCILEYYFYMAANYRNQMSELIAEKELHITKQRLSLLQNQIQPHFIFNSLSIIRSLAKHDSVKAVDCIDSFSDYLKAHVYALRDDEMVPFSEELSNIKAYLNLVQADSRRNVTVEYDLKELDFMIPALSLEPIVENAIKYGVGPEGGMIRIESFIEDDQILVRIIDDGKGEGNSSMTDQEVTRLGIGLSNTRKRLELHSDATLDMDKTDHGTIVTIRIPNS